MNISRMQKQKCRVTGAHIKNRLLNKREVRVMFKEMADDFKRIASEFKINSGQA